MTDPTPPPGHEPDADGPTRALGPGTEPQPADAAALDPVDEAASAALDGQALDPARTVDDELLAARVEELSAVSALVAAPVTPPGASVVDVHVAAALAELRPPAARPTMAPAGPAVVPLESRRRRPAVSRWLAVAAAIAVVALAIPIVQSLSESSSTSSSTAASVASSDSSAPDAASTDDQELHAADAPPGSSTTATTPAFGETTSDPTQSDGDIGTADDPTELAALVHEHAPDATDQSTTQSTADAGSGSPPTTIAPLTTRSSPPACDAAARAHHPGLGSLRYTASATYQTIPVVVLVYEVPDPTTISYRLIVARTDTCAVLLDVPYA
jgi:hypothetical protein